MTLRFNGWQSVLAHHARSDERADRWAELNRLASAGEVLEYYRHYADYLEWDGIISDSRRSMHRMALEVVRILEMK